MKLLDHEGSEVPKPGAAAAALDALRRFPRPPRDRTAPEIDGERWTRDILRWWTEVVRPIVRNFEALCFCHGLAWDECPTLLQEARDLVSGGQAPAIRHPTAAEIAQAKRDDRLPLGPTTYSGVDLASGPDAGGFLCGVCGFTCATGDEMLAHDCADKQ